MTKILLITILHLNCFAHAQTPNFIDVVNRNVAIVRNSMNESTPFRSHQVYIAAQFLTRFTGIASTADGSYAGQFPPNEVDLKNWVAWLQANYKFYYWAANDFKYLNFKSQSFFKNQLPLESGLEQALPVSSK